MATETLTPRLRTIYNEEVVPKMIKDHGFENVMEVPRLLKISLNMGVGEAHSNAKLLETSLNELTAIAGQKAVVALAKRSIAGFKIREGMPIGVRVTLRREQMWYFLDRFIHIALPRVRDFKGVSPNAFDGRGNYTVGVTEQIIFPEIDYEKVDQVRGISVSIVTTAENDEHGRALLAELGMPFKKKNQASV